jgi:hypothetical protein
MQTKGGGKHDILPVGGRPRPRSIACGMMPRDPDADMCPAVQGTTVSTKDCMAHQSSLSAADGFGPRSAARRVRGALNRAVSQVRLSSTDGGVHDAQVQQPPN